MAVTKQISARFLAIAIAIVVFASAVSLIIPNIISSEVDVMLGDGIFKTVIAKNATDRSMYLNRISTIQSKTALMLAYPSNSRWSVNSDDLSNSVDIVWLDNTKRVVDVLRNVKINNGRLIPNNSCRYILILSPGVISSESIAIGHYANFMITESEIE